MPTAMSFLPEPRPWTTVGNGASPVDDSGKYKAGDTIRQSFPLAVTQEKAKSLAKIYFTE